MAMIPLGKKISVETSPRVSKNEVSYPYLNINKKMGITKKEVGKIVTAKVKLKVTSHEERIDKDGRERYSCSFDVLGIDFGSKSLDQLEKEEYDRMPIKARR